MVSMLARLLAVLRRLLPGHEEQWVHPSNAITRYVLGERPATSEPAPPAPAASEEPAAEQPADDAAASAA